MGGLAFSPRGSARVSFCGGRVRIKAFNGPRAACSCAKSPQTPASELVFSRKSVRDEWNSCLNVRLLDPRIRSSIPSKLLRSPHRLQTFARIPDGSFDLNTRLRGNFRLFVRLPSLQSLFVDRRFPASFQRSFFLSDVFRLPFKSPVFPTDLSD